MLFRSEAEQILQLSQREPQLNQLLHEKLPYLRAEVIWQVREEMARTVEDVLARRTHALLLDARASINVADDVAELMGRELGWNAGQCSQSAHSFREMAKAYVLTL